MNISNKHRFGNIALEILYINHYRWISHPGSKHKKPHNKRRRIENVSMRRVRYLLKNKISRPTSNRHFKLTHVKIGGRVYSILYHDCSQSTCPALLVVEEVLVSHLLNVTRWLSKKKANETRICADIRKKYDINKIYGSSCDLLFVNVCVRFKLDFRVSHSTL